MRVALFFDGKNFYSGLKDRAPNKIIDFTKMSKWLVQMSGGSNLWGAYYYTGVETMGASRVEAQTKLCGFLDMLEMQPGFFVKRFPRKVQTYTCQECHAENRFTLEKEIDTTMVADMLRLAAVNAFDIMVLLSGDADHAPAVEGVRAIGKQVYVATWGKTGLSSRIRKAAFDHIDLMQGIDDFNIECIINTSESSDVYSEEEIYELPNNQKEVFIEELEKAMQTFSSGYVGMNYFIKRWQADRLEQDHEERKQMLDELVEERKVEIYEAPDGNKAIRTLKDDDYAYDVDDEYPDEEYYEDDDNEEEE